MGRCILLELLCKSVKISFQLGAMQERKDLCFGIVAPDHADILFHTLHRTCDRCLVKLPSKKSILSFPQEQQLTAIAARSLVLIVLVSTKNGMSSIFFIEEPRMDNCAIASLPIEGSGVATITHSFLIKSSEVFRIIVNCAVGIVHRFSSVWLSSPPGQPREVLLPPSNSAKPP